MSMSDEFRSEPPDDLPADFWSWPPAAQVEWACSMYQRGGLIMKLLSRSSYEIDEPVGKDHHLTKEELAAIYILLRRVER